MDRIAVAGLSIQRADVSELELVTRPPSDRLAGWLRELGDVLGASEVVFLATCNRVEVIYAREEGETPSERDLQALAAHLVGSEAEEAVEPLHRSLSLRCGRQAVQHLFRVTASLDSLTLGEDQILAQVRAAYGTSADLGLTGPLLGPLFHHALAIGKQVRSETELARHPTSIVNLAMAALQEEPEAATLRTAVVGAGEMGALLVRTLRTAGLGPHVIANRSIESARRLAKDSAVEALSLADFLAGAQPVDVILTATAAPATIVSPEQLLALAARTPSGRPLLGVDLAVPRDLPVVDDPRVRVLDLDALRAHADENRARRAEAAAVAEELVERKVHTFTRRYHEELAAPAVTELRRSSEEILGRELEGLLGGRLAHLPEADRKAVERWARATFGRLMHLPVSALKRMANELHDGAGASEDLP